jgi:hypothetical protein
VCSSDLVVCRDLWKMYLQNRFDIRVDFGIVLYWFGSKSDSYPYISDYAYPASDYDWRYPSEAWRENDPMPVN